MDTNQQLQVFRDALAKSPTSVMLWTRYGDLLAALGQYGESLNAYLDALRIQQDHVVLRKAIETAIHLGENETRDRLLADLLSSETTPEDLLFAARVSLRAGDEAAALAYYLQAQENQPDLQDVDLDRLLLPAAGPERELAAKTPIPLFRRNGESEETVNTEERQRPGATFADVGGLDAVKQTMRTLIVEPFLHPELYLAYGRRVGGGVLLYGPPGCGKTFMAKAVAGECRATFYGVGLEDVLDMYAGEPERKLHAIFEQARRTAPAVLFFDEMDAMGGDRSKIREHFGRTLISQFLMETDGIATKNQNLLLLGATNAPWRVDAALRRSGRFERLLFVPPPDATARKRILKLKCQGRPLGEVDFGEIARRTERFSGADLTQLAERATDLAMEAAIAAGGIHPLTTREFLRALPAVKPSTHEWFADAKNYALYRNDGGIYDDVLAYLREHS